MAPSLTKTHPFELDEPYLYYVIEDLDNGESYDLDLGDLYGKVWYWVELTSGAAYVDGELVLQDGISGAGNPDYPTGLGTHVRPADTSTMGLVVEPGQLLRFDNQAGGAQNIKVHVLALDQK